jgi:hypothetical protein
VTTWALRLDDGTTLRSGDDVRLPGLPGLRGKGTACAVFDDDILLASTIHVPGDDDTADGDVGNEGVLVHISVNPEAR